jgi:hypothetical protein
MSKEPKTYATAAAFRRALEERLKQTAQAEQVDVNRLRRQVAFDRLLARLFQTDHAPWTLKGGYALELRLKAARSTVDVDLTMQRAVLASGDSDQANAAIREMLQGALTPALGDWLEYLIGAPMLDLDGAPYGGARYPVEARMDARVFARFHLDVGVGDVIIEPLETIECRQWLQFAGIGSPRVAVISREQHFAEKLHAYTLPRPRPNTRVKDLVDMALLIQTPGLSSEKTADAIHMTFNRRKTHEAPVELPAPPENWQTQFSALATECHLPLDLTEAWNAIRAFLSQVPI